MLLIQLEIKEYPELTVKHLVDNFLEFVVEKKVALDH